MWPNIGGVYEYYKTYDQDGAVYSHVPKSSAKLFIVSPSRAFQTPTWLLEEDVLNKIDFAGQLIACVEHKLGLLVLFSILVDWQE